MLPVENAQYKEIFASITVVQSLVDFPNSKYDNNAVPEGDWYNVVEVPDLIVSIGKNDEAMHKIKCLEHTIKCFQKIEDPINAIEDMLVKFNTQKEIVCGGRARYHNNRETNHTVSNTECPKQKLQ